MPPKKFLPKCDKKIFNLLYQNFGIFLLKLVNVMNYISFYGLNFVKICLKKYWMGFQIKFNSIFMQCHSTLSFHMELNFHIEINSFFD